MSDPGDECGCVQCQSSTFDTVRRALDAVRRVNRAPTPRATVQCSDEMWEQLVLAGYDRYYNRTGAIPEPIESIDNRVRHLMQGQRKPGRRR